MIPNKLNIAVALMLVLGACGKKHDTPIPTPTARAYMNKMAGQYVMSGQYTYLCTLCAVPETLMEYLEWQVNLYVLDDTAIALAHAEEPGRAMVLYLLNDDIASGCLYFVSRNDSMNDPWFVNYYIARDSIVYYTYSLASGNSTKRLVHTP